MPHSHIFAELLDCFVQLDRFVPGSSTWFGELIMGRLPDANPAEIYELADAWGAVTDRVNQYYRDTSHSADAITAGWGGDGAAMAFHESWNEYQQSIAAVAEGIAGIQQVVQGYGLELELEEFFVAISLIELLIIIIQAAVSAFFTGGLSLGEVFVQLGITRVAIKAAWEAAKHAIMGLSKSLARGEFKKRLSISRCNKPARRSVEAPATFHERSAKGYGISPRRWCTAWGRARSWPGRRPTGPRGTSTSRR